MPSSHKRERWKMEKKKRKTLIFYNKDVCFCYPQPQGMVNFYSIYLGFSSLLFSILPFAFKLPPGPAFSTVNFHFQ